MTIHLNCTACSAPLETDGSTATVRCQYCDSIVVVPPELRPKSSASRPPRKSAEPAAAKTLGRGSTARQTGKRPAAGGPFVIDATPVTRSKGCVGLLVTLAILAVTGVILASALIPLGMWRYSRGPTSTITTLVEEIPLPPRIATLLPTAVPGFATEIARFGSEGIGPGYFDDARAIGLDNQGRVYVGEYSSGRVQVFDESGTFQGQWSFPEDSYVGAFGVDRQGRLYAGVSQELVQVDGQTGAVLATLSDSDDGWVGDGVAIAPDGRIVYEAGDDIVRLGTDGEVDLVIADAIQEASGESNIGMALAVDGLGNIFAIAISQDVVYKFSPDGRFLDRFGERDVRSVPGQGQFSAASSIAIDPQGRVYIGDIDGVQVFDGTGRYLDLIDVDAFPSGLVFNDAGELFVAARDHVVRFRINGPAN